MSRIMEETGAVLYVKGQHVEPALKHRTQLAPGVKFLHVEIIAPTPIQVQRARWVALVHGELRGSSYGSGAPSIYMTAPN